MRDQGEVTENTGDPNDVPMLTIEDLQGIQSFNEKTVLAALRHAEIMMADVLEVRASQDRKVFHLIPFFITATTAMVSAPYLNIFVEVPGIYWACYGTALCFAVGCVSLLWALTGKTYWTRGDMPHSWLFNADVLSDQTDKMRAYMNACVIHHYEKRIESSRKANTEKGICINIAIFSALVGPVIFLLALAFFRWLA